MVPINRNPNIPPILTGRDSPAISLPKSRSPSPVPRATKDNLNGNSPFSDLHRFSSRSAPVPNQHCVIDILPETIAQDAVASASPRPRVEQGELDGSLPLPLATRSSRSVSFQRKVAATLKTSMAVSVPMAAINAFADNAGSTVLGTVRHVSGPIGTNLKVALTAGSMGIAAEVAGTVLVTAAGHKYLDKIFYHDQDKSADEMIAAKKANSAAFAYLGSTGSSTAMSLAATALTGGTVTASVVKTTLLTQAVGGLIVHPVVIGVAVSALAYHHAKNGADRAPDSLQAGIEAHVSWIKEKLTTTGLAKPSIKPAAYCDDASVISPGDNMV